MSNQIYSIGTFYVRAPNALIAKAIAYRVSDGESDSIKLQWRAPIPTRAIEYANQQFGIAGYDAAIENELLGLIEKFAIKARGNNIEVKRKARELKATVYISL